MLPERLVLAPQGPLLLALTALGLTHVAQAQSSNTQVLGTGRGAPPPRAVYVSDEATNDRLELYAVPVDGSAIPEKLNGTLPIGGGVDARLFRPLARDRAVFVADQLVNDVFELFVSSPAGPVRLSGPLVADGDVSDFLVAGHTVVYRADGTLDGRDELYAVSTEGDGRAPISLTPGVDTLRLVGLTRDGARALFLKTFSVVEELWVVATDGLTPPLRLGDSGFPTGFYSYFAQLQLSPTETHVVFVTGDDDDSIILWDLYAVPIDGSTAQVDLNPGPSTGSPITFQVSPDGQRVVATRLDVAPLVQHFQSVRIDGTDRQALGGGAFIGGFAITPDSHLVAYVASASWLSGPHQLLLELVGGSTPLTLTPLSNDRMTLIGLAPVGLTLLYETSDTTGARRLFSLSTPNNPVTLLDNVPPGQGLENGRTTFDPTPRRGPLFTPDGKRVVFRADLSADDVYGVYGVRLDGSEPLQELNPPLSGDQDVDSFRLTEDGRTVLFKADPFVTGRFELFGAPVDGSSPAVPLGATPTLNGDVHSYLPGRTPTGRHTAKGP
jgi:hypothetical protein